MTGRPTAGSGAMGVAFDRLAGQSWRRLPAIVAGAVLIGSSLSVFHRVTTVAGGGRWFAVGVGAAGVLATAAARLTTTRRGLAAGTVLLLGGVVAYVAMVPAIRSELLSVGFARRWLAYLTGITVLNFRQADLWAIAVAPGYTYLSWFLLLRRRYAAAALVGGGMLLFFVSTGDAGAGTALAGWTSLLALLGAGVLEREEADLDRLLELGFVLALGAIVARSVQVAPGGGKPVDAGDGGGEAGRHGASLAALDTADARANIGGAISLSPRVLFTVDGAPAANRHVGAYDRYTGADWVRTGSTRPYGGALEPPPASARRIAQTVTAEADVGALPAAWKPVEVVGLADDRLRVTALGDVVLAAPLRAGEAFRVASARPVQAADRLRAAGTADPTPIVERYGQLPGDTPDRVRALAAEIAGDAPTRYDAARAVRRWLLANKSYRLEVEPPDGDVVDGFLFSMEAGYCVYFASAMAVLLRAVGVPSRFVLGYGPGQRVGEARWVVRGFDAHAWVQAYVPGVGWVPFDPTPAGPRLAARQRHLAAARDRGVPNVDTNDSRGQPLRQTATPDATATTGPESTTPAADPAMTPDDQPTVGVPAGAPADGSGVDPVGAVDDWLVDRDRISLLAGGVATAIGLHWLGVGRWARDELRVRWQPATASPARDVRRARRRLELVLARRYRPKRDGETARQYVERVGADETVAARRRVVELYERAVYGSGVTRAEADEAIRLVDGLVGREPSDERSAAR